ncbi:hypothetical protein FQN50_006138 [Emmonsiellopsis sp. PD_5]|nr:hypothetical protein FQN50_006138 [Emmonsiellopsis sp. PD_5]
MAVSTVKQLDSLLLTLARFLNDNEISSDECRNRYDALPNPEKLTLGKLFKRRRKTKDRDNDKDTPLDGEETDDEENADGEEATDEENDDVNADIEGEADDEENSDNGKQADANSSAGEALRLFQVSACEIQLPLHATLKSCKEKKGPGPFFEALSRQFHTNRGIGATYFRIRQGEEKDILLQILRRFQLREMYLYAVRYRYHTGKSWRNNGILALAKEINSQCPYLQDSVAEVAKQLQHYVELGRGYDTWVVELGHPGYLFAMPLEVSETEYTKRLYRKHIPNASREFRDMGLDDVVSHWELGNLGEAVSKILEESSQPSKTYESGSWDTEGDVTYTFVAEQAHVPLLRPSEFAPSASKRPRFQPRDTSGGGHDTPPITVSDGSVSVSNTDDNRSEQSSEASSPSNATDPTEDGNLTEAIADIVQNQQTVTTGERAISLSQKPYLLHGSRTQVTSPPASSHGSLFPDENVSSADNHQQSSKEPRQSISSETGLTQDEVAASDISTPSTELIACIEQHGKCS